MSRWRERLCIGLGAERVVCLRKTGWLRSRVVAKEAITVAAATSEPWSNTLTALDVYLKKGKNRKTPLHIVLSNRFVRYVALPWHEAVISRSERVAQARHYFRQIYGDIAQTWSIECSPSRYGKAALAAAVDSSLLARLHHVAAENDCTVKSIEPYLSASYGYFCRSVRSAAGRTDFLCVVEPDQIACLSLERGAPHEVLNQHAHRDWEKEVHAILLQTRVEHSRAGELEIAVFAPEAPASRVSDDGRLKCLLAYFPRGLSAATDGPFAMAMLASG